MRRWQTNVSKRPSCGGLDGRFFHGSEMRGSEEKNKKTIYFLQMSPRMASLRQGNVLMYFFQQYTGGQGYEQRHFNSQAERGRVP